MTIQRIVPNAATADIAANHAFYGEFLGMDLVMAMDWIVTYASRSNPTAQVSLITADATAPVVADISIEVGNVDLLHDLAVLRGERIVYPLTDEPWGVRRFFVADPNGRVINLVQHRS